MTWDELFKRFVKEKKFLQNVTDKTRYWYEFSWASYKRMTGGEEIDRFRLNEYMVKLRESGVSAASANTYAILRTVTN